MADASDPIVVLAAVAGAHGIRGEVRLKLFTETLGQYRTLVAGGGTLTLESLRPGTGGGIARFAEVGDRTAAEALRGTTLGVPRSTLPPLDDGEYYHADLIGRPAVTTGDAPLGRVVAVENFGAGDLVEIEREDGRRFLVPVAAGVADLGPPLRVHPEFVEG